MDQGFDYAQFTSLFPDDLACLEEIKRQRFPYGIYCTGCQKITKHYKLRNRVSYSCKICRRHVYPLSGTLFEKSSTPLRIWFYAIFLIIHTRDTITTKQLQRELGVTYKTAWRIRKNVRTLMELNNGDLLKGYIQEEYKERRWLFFNKLEIKVVHKQEPSGASEDE